MRPRFLPRFTSFLANLLTCLLIAPQIVRGDTVMVFAAVSLAESLSDAAREYESKSSDRIVFNLGASSLLARQISEGAPADLFFSADEAKMDGLEKAGHLVPSTRRARLSNQLVIITPKDSGIDLPSPATLASPIVHHLALADPLSVPAGIYAKAYLERQKLWTAAEPKIVPAENVRAALALVESGEVEAGIVYRTDAAISKRVKVVLNVPVDQAPAIRYPVALISGAAHEKAARGFLNFLNSAEAATVFRRHGFGVID